MKRPGLVLFAISLIVAAFPSKNVLAADESGDMTGMKYDDDTAEGRMSLGYGEMVHFVLPKAGEKIAGIRIHGSRYATPEPPKEQFLVYFMNPDETEVLSTQLAPYSLFSLGDEKPGKEKWVDVTFAHPVEAPQDFWVVLDFRATPRKGVFVSYDTSTGGKHSRVGLPGVESRPADFGGDWMIELIPAK